ncbi:hypothetical protein H4F64_01755 [Pectobacterium brasiliense]|uniref:hypothetical protein n=1 Tax=Pectobacterium TaxID=122277 RepID=UPI001968E5BC|nr:MULTISPECIES: hypothetical protein [Pectobacterium]MBN3188938.1 hypothetical protein [Pectobacterium brasiliense]MCL6330623.1 hypothetical protein [Pectobacterium carotovorum subsp. carotovorum]
MSLKKYKIMSGDLDKTDEIFDTILRLGIDKEILARSSTLLIIQIYASLISRAENVFKIIDEINKMEGTFKRGLSHTKEPAMFGRKPYLKGLWHKHYMGSDVSSMAKNAMNALKNYGLPKLNAEIEEVARLGEERYFTPDDAGKIAHEAVVDNYLRRSCEGKLTGHWIIYAIHNGINYYLCLARHTDDEKEIRKEIDAICLNEFPFLKEILHPFSE